MGIFRYAAFEYTTLGSVNRKYVWVLEAFFHLAQGNNAAVLHLGPQWDLFTESNLGNQTQYTLFTVLTLATAALHVAQNYLCW